MSASPASDIGPIPARGRILVAFSGGPDSVCLLHALLEATDGERLRCLHVDHGIDAESAARARRAVELSARAGVPCTIAAVEVGSGAGIEAAARAARYRALAEAMETGETLATAHHADDQVETILLRLLRGAGPEGLAGIPRSRPFGPGRLIRPLLDWTRAEIQAYLATRGLEAVEDPANEQLEFDRNDIRHRLLPMIRERWPGADRSILRSGHLCGGAAGFIRERVTLELDTALCASGALDLDRLAADDVWYLGEIVRRWCLQLDWEPPPGRQLDEFVAQLQGARSDRQPELRWDNHAIRCWRRRLWALPGADPTPAWRRDWDGAGALELPHGLGRLELAGTPAEALTLTVSTAQPGDRIRTAAGTRSVRQLLAEDGVPPWLRAGWPLIRQEDRVVALPPDRLEPDFAELLARRGQRLSWRRHHVEGTMPGLKSRHD